MQSGVNKSTFEVSHELQHEKKMTKSHKIFDGIFKSFTERFRTQCYAIMQGGVGIPTIKCNGVDHKAISM